MEWAIVKRERERVCLRVAMTSLAASVRTKRSSARCHCICFSLFLYANSPLCFNCLCTGVVTINCMGKSWRHDRTGGGEKYVCVSLLFHSPTHLSVSTIFGHRRFDPPIIAATAATSRANLLLAAHATGHPPANPILDRLPPTLLSKRNGGSSDGGKGTGNRRQCGCGSGGEQ